MEQLKQYHRQKVHHNNIEILNIHHTPYLSQLSSISLMNKLNKIGDRGHPCLNTTINRKFFREITIKKKKKKKNIGFFFFFYFLR